MPTDRPRFMVTITEDMRSEIDNYRYEHRCRSQTQAINELIELGLSALNRELDAQKEQPADIGELSENEERYLKGFDELTPSNRRILLGLLSLLLQEQERAADSPG